jgi:signal peptidase complex subunit 3
MRSLRSIGGVDRALMSFDLTADLRPAWHWNLKQLFVYIVAEYETNKAPLNQVIIWDKIIESEKASMIRLNKEFVKYALIAQGPELRNREITLKLMWDHMPITGRVYVHDQGDSKYTLPGNYSRNK